MQYMKTVTVPSKTKEVVDKTVCDFCNTEITPLGRFDETEIKISKRIGEMYPEGCGWYEHTTFDCCLSCWDGKVLPMLESLGARPSRISVDY